MKEIRSDFPCLNRKLHGNPLIYLDNTATTHKPSQVIESVKEFYENYNANIHRGIHDLSQQASEMYENAHDKVAEFINANGQEEIIFVRNTTEGINLVAHSYQPHLEKGDEILVTLMEHHSNILPWLELEKRQGIHVKFVRIKEDGTLDYKDLKTKLTRKTKLVAVTHISNVLGTINNVKKITKLAHEKNALVLVDGAQSAPHIPVNVKDIDFDFFTFSGHKMLGPTGIGVLYGKEHLLRDLIPYQRGGGSIESVKWTPKKKRVTTKWKGLPWKFEAGTPNIAGGIGLAEAIKYLEEVSMSSIQKHEQKLTKYALDRIQDEVENITIYGPTDPKLRVGVISFTIDSTSLTYHDVAGIFNEYGIAVRSGFHCAQPLHEFFEIKGSIRASFYLYNTKEEVDRFIKILKKVTGI